MMPSWVRKIEGRLYNMIGRARIDKISDNKVQTASMSTGPDEAFKNVERLQNYGVTSFPGPNADALALFLTGSKELPLIIAADHPDLRPLIAEWEIALWTKFGTKVHLKADGSIQLVANTDLIMKSGKAAIDFGTEAIIKTGKFSVSSGSVELIAVLIETVETLIKLNAALVPSTGIPAPIKAELAVTLPQILAKLQIFKA